MKNKVRTIDVTAKEWFDKVNGNSYFAGIVTINYGMKTEKNYVMPFKYGYSDYYLQAAKKLLIENKVLNPFDSGLTYYCRENNITLRYIKQENCRKKDLINYISNI
jgi:hypothetical protein